MLGTCNHGHSYHPGMLKTSSRRYLESSYYPPGLNHYKFTYMLFIYQSRCGWPLVHSNLINEFKLCINAL